MNVGVFYAISTLLNQVIEFVIKNSFLLFKCTNSAPTLYYYCYGKCGIIGVLCNTSINAGSCYMLSCHLNCHVTLYKWNCIM